MSGPSYNWVCPACEKTVEKSAESCTYCGCPAHANAFEVNRYRDEVFPEVAEKIREQRAIIRSRNAASLRNTGVAFAGGFITTVAAWIIQSDLLLTVGYSISFVYLLISNTICFYDHEKKRSQLAKTNKGQ